MTDTEHVPVADMRSTAPREGVPFLAWVVPIGAVVLAIVLILLAVRSRGVLVTVRFDDGHGLRVGDPVRHRGIDLGVVESVESSPDLRGVVVRARLDQSAERVAHAGTRFWIVRPELGVSGVTGVDALVGPRYLALEPGSPDGASRREFVGLAGAPTVLTETAGDLEIVLVGAERGSLRPGAPLRYRDVRIGTVRSAGLASDGRAIEARVHVESAYRDVIRGGSRFWDSGGVRATVGLTGGQFEIDSLENLLTGGVSVATPALEEAGEPVNTGHRFRIYDRVDPRWLAWSPSLVIGNDLLPPGAVLASPYRANLTWREGRVLKSDESRTGWMLLTTAGALAPTDLLRADEDANEGTVSLEVAGARVTFETEPAWEGPGLMLRPLDVSVDVPWAWAHRRRPSAPENVVAMVDAATPPLPLGTDALSERDGSWIIDESVSVDASWHGAPVLSREDGMLVGMLLVDDDDAARVVLVPPEG